MSSQRSILGKWALHRRWEAHLAFPALASAVLIAWYFFLPGPLQLMVAPGFVELPFGQNRVVGLPHFAMGFCLAWTVTLAWSTVGLTRDRSVWFVGILVLVGIVMFTLVWVDGNSLLSRASALIRMNSAQDDSLLGLLADYHSLVGLAGFGLFTFVFFVVLPLVYGDTRNPVAAMLIPSRWLALTSGVMFVAFIVAFRLQQMGWDQSTVQTGNLSANLGLLVQPLFVYMVMLYMARLQYLTWVRREALHWNPANRFR